MDIQLMISDLPDYLQGAGVTLRLTVEALLFGILGGLVIAMMKMCRVKVLNIIASVYISIIRGTPLLLQIIFIYYSLPSLGISLSAITSGILGLSINTAAYMAETIRGGIMAVDKGQAEAAHTLGYNTFQSYFYIILPQAFKIILPQIGNTSISMIKDTSLVSVITITELMRAAQVNYAITFKPLESYLLAGVIYYIMSAVVSRIFVFAEKKMKRC